MNQLPTTLPRLCAAHYRIVAAARGLRCDRKTRALVIARLKTAEAALRQRGVAVACPYRVIQFEY